MAVTYHLVKYMVQEIAIENLKARVTFLERNNKRLKKQQAALNYHGERTKSEILNGLRNGEGLQELFFSACEGIGNITGEKVFLSSVKELYRNTSLKNI